MALAGSGANADVVYAFPQAVISPVNTEAAAFIMAPDKMKVPANEQHAVAEQFAQETLSAFYAAQNGFVDGIVEETELRSALLAALDMLAGKRVPTVAKKRFIDIKGKSIMKNFRITVNGTAYDVQVEEMGENAAPAAAAPAPVAASAPAPKKAAAPAGAVGNISVKAPMPGTVVNVVVTTGQSVKAGDDLVFIEAMKMETPVKAPQDATVATIEVSKGEAVDSGKVLVTLN